MRSTLFKWGTVSIVLAIFVVLIFSASSAFSQCGNVDNDGGGGFDISDISALIDYLYVSHPPLPVYPNAELDGHENVNVSDLYRAVRFGFCDFVNTFSCVPLGAPLVPTPKPGSMVWLGQGIYPGNIGSAQPYTVELYLSTQIPISSMTIPFQILIDGVPANIVPGSLVVAPIPSFGKWGLTDGTNVLVSSTGCAPIVTPKMLLATMQIIATSSSTTPRPISLWLDPYPVPTHPISGARVHQPMLLRQDGMLRASPDSLIIDAILPTVCNSCSNATAIGSATLTDSSGALIVDNIGASGNDGVAFDATDADSLQLDFISENLSDSGSEMSVDILGTVVPLANFRAASPTDVVLMGWKIANAGGPLQLKCDFNPLGDPNVLIAAYNGATLQGSTSVPGGGVVALATTAGSGNPQVKSLWLVKSNPCTFEVLFDRPATVTTTNSQVYLATRVRFIALGQTIPIQQIKTVQVAGKNTRLVIAKFFARTGGCCRGFTGNVDCDANENIDIADITTIIDYLYISFTPLCCQKSANCDGSLDGNVDISDLAALLDFSYISFTPTAPCQ